MIQNPSPYQLFKGNPSGGENGHKNLTSGWGNNRPDPEEAGTDFEILNGNYSKITENMARLPEEIREAVSFVMSKNSKSITFKKEKLFLCIIKKVLETREGILKRIKNSVCGLLGQGACQEIPLEKFPSNIKKYLDSISEDHKNALPVLVSREKESSAEEIFKGYIESISEDKET